MKAYWISALLLVTCASAVTGISNSSSVYGAAANTPRDQLTILRSTSDPFVLAASLKGGVGGNEVVQPTRNDIFSSRASVSSQIHVKH